MVTSTLEINNSVCLNPGKKADTVLQDFLTHFDGAELQMFCGFKEETHFFFLLFLGGYCRSQGHILTQNRRLH